ncbi:major facilitator superfamily domain-containing protein [Podospora australis]|uniref:Major facilitator superfamily domain-containing protein n=1 Tax=Podospora australis TaxID=1536484 RepID=A0AAN7ABM2_9PEZI|nr:major facilitator superfamily domain-containing protein [Podospora australis]
MPSEKPPSSALVSDPPLDSTQPLPFHCQPPIIATTATIPASPYSHFSPARKRYLTILLGYLTLASSLTATIYLPLLPLLSDQYHVSLQQINLTITFYVIFQALSPAIFAPISDTFGRRPILLLSFLIYLAASLGLALNDIATKSYAGLLVLRGLQSLGGSAVMALAYGVVADVVPHSERGSMLGPLLAATNLGPCLGPVIGGGIASSTRGGTGWCFWTLGIFAGVAVGLIGFTLPETARRVVGDGGVKARGVWGTWGCGNYCLSARGSKGVWGVGDEGKGVEGVVTACETNTPEKATGKGSFPHPYNPLAPLRIVFHADTFLTLWVAATVYTVWYCIQTSIPIIFGEIYHWSELEVGLSYLAGGTGVIAGGFVNGKLMDWNYRSIAKKAGRSVDRVSGDDIMAFPMERARSRGSISLFAFSICALVGYGWAVHYQIHPSVPLVLQFLVGAEGTMIHQSFNALLVDIFPESPSTAAAAGNITRCAMSAAVVACIQPLVETMGYGWFYTLVGLVSGCTGSLAIACLRFWGWGWRRARHGHRLE